MLPDFGYDEPEHVGTALYSIEVLCLVAFFVFQ
jgi:hypothetical protein